MIRKPMRSTLVVTTAATDLTLLTVEERREAAGLDAGDASKDATLLALDQRVAAAIASECNIAIGNGGEPTLKKETLTETFYSVYLDRLLLARRHNADITSLTDGDTALTATDYIVDPEAGIVTRMRSDCPSAWRSSKIVVVYEAGFETIPGDLKFAAMDFLKSLWLAKSRDPFLKSDRTEVTDIMVQQQEYWIGAIPGQQNDGAVPEVIAGSLKRFRNYRV